VSSIDFIKATKAIQQRTTLAMNKYRKKPWGYSISSGTMHLLEAELLHLEAVYIPDVAAAPEINAGVTVEALCGLSLAKTPTQQTARPFEYC
jgi:hypothetical protein